MDHRRCPPSAQLMGLPCYPSGAFVTLSQGCLGLGRLETPKSVGWGLGRIEPIDPTLIRCLQDRVNPGKKSSKFNQDCTICASCRRGRAGPVVLKWQENRVKWRAFGVTAIRYRAGRAR